MPEFTRPFVLIVDDEPEVRDVIARQVAHLGYEVVAATGGAAAVDLCRDRGPVVVVLDVRMPEMDGPATLDALRALSPGLPCVFVSGDPRPHTVPDLLARGATAFVAKPFRLAQLKAALAALAPILAPTA